MSLESTYFKNNFHYKAKFINKCIAIIRFSKDERRVKAFKNLVFRMMKDVVKKNVSNYLNLLKNTYKKDMVPDRDEVIVDCYIIFDKCLEKYKIDKKYNFYFYFNKSLSRKFFKSYQKEYKRSNDIQITDALQTVHESFHDYREPDTTELLMDHLGFTDLEKRICRSKMLGQKTVDFLSENKDISSTQYSKTLKKIKETLSENKEKGEI